MSLIKLSKRHMYLQVVKFTVLFSLLTLTSLVVVVSAYWLGGGELASPNPLLDFEVSFPEIHIEIPDYLDSDNIVDKILSFIGRFDKIESEHTTMIIPTTISTEHITSTSISDSISTTSTTLSTISVSTSTTTSTIAADSTTTSLNPVTTTLDHVSTSTLPSTSTSSTSTTSTTTSSTSTLYSISTSSTTTSSTSTSTTLFSSLQTILNHPPHGFVTANRNITLAYSPIGPSTFSNCSVYVNFTGTLKTWGVDTTIFANQSNTFSFFDLTAGTYAWNVKCISLSGQSAENIFDNVFIIH